MFEFHQKVLFKHCDPAGIVFYPRYFEMINDAIEAFFEEGLNWPFEQTLLKGGIPTAEITAKFTAPSRHADRLVLCLRVLAVGNTSCEIEILAKCEQQQRFISRSRIVRVGENGRPEAWPAQIKTKLQELAKDENDA